MPNLQHLVTQPPTVRPLPVQRLEERWPVNALEAFSLKMAEHGMSVSCTLMHRDTLYALEQLQHAMEIADDELRELAGALFLDFQKRRSGVKMLN